MADNSALANNKLTGEKALKTGFANHKKAYQEDRKFYQNAYKRGAIT